MRGVTLGDWTLQDKKIGILKDPGLQDSFVTPDTRLAQGGQVTIVCYGFFLPVSPDFE